MPLPQAPPPDPVEALYEAPPAFAPPAPTADVRPSRPWYRKKRYIVLVGLHAVIAVAFFASGGEGGNPSPTANPAQGAQQQKLFPGRPDAQPEDQEREIGQSARIGDLEAVVNEAGFQQSVSEFESDGYAVAVVNISNVGTGSGTEAYDPLQWRLLLPNGQVLDAEIVTLADSLGSGDLISGGSVSGRVVFGVKDQRGDLYILYKPNPLDAARGVWKVTI